MAWYGRFCQEQGHHRRAIRWCMLAVAAAESVGDRAVLADALRVMDWAAMDLGEPRAPGQSGAGPGPLRGAGRPARDRPGCSTCSAGSPTSRATGKQASALYLRAQATVRRTGNAVMDAFYVFNLGEIALDQGRLDEAQKCPDLGPAHLAGGGLPVRGRLCQGQAGTGRHRTAPVTTTPSASVRRGDRGALRHRQPGRGAGGPVRPGRVPPPPGGPRCCPVAGRRDDSARPRRWAA